MNFVLTYDLKLTGQERTSIETRIDNVLKPYKYAKNLSTFYVIHIDSYTQWDQILVSMTNIAKDLVGKFHFIMSPPVNGGRYNGYLPYKSWETINGITSLD